MGFEQYINEIQQAVRTMRLLTDDSPEMPDIKETVSGYQKERQEGKDGIRYVSQTFWYGNQLARRAMERHGIWLKEIYFERPKSGRTRGTFIGDGNQTRINYNGQMIKKKIYYRGMRPILKIHSALEEEYILADTATVNSKTKYCERCGALNRITEDYAGCDYCGAPMRIKEVHKKIVSFQSDMTGDWYQKMMILSASVLVFCMAIIGNIRQLFAEGIFDYGINLGLILYSLFTGVFMAGIYGPILGIFLGNFFFIPIIISIQNSESRVLKVGQKMRRKDPDFSETEFYGIIQAYTKLWLLSQNRNELGCISEIAGYEDNSVVDADCLACKGQKVWVDKGFCYINMKLKMRLIRMYDKVPKAQRKTLSVTMRRRADAKSCLTTESFSCPDCGSAVDILKGDHCSYCGKKLEAAETNWVLHDVKVR